MSKKLIYDIPLTKIAIRKGIKLPVELNNDLAYLCGVFAGDGSISIEKRNNQYKYYLTYTGNALDEKEFYHEIIAPRLRNVFGIEPKVKHNKRDNTYVSRINSKPIILFLTEIIGLPKGKKYDFLKIPELFLREESLVINFIRGLFDTDGCISFKKRDKPFPYYPVICLSSKSRKFLLQIAIFLKEMGFKFSKVYTYRVNDVRFKLGYNIISRIELSGHNNLKLWRDKVDFFSPKHLLKIKKYWKIAEGRLPYLC